MLICPAWPAWVMELMVTDGGSTRLGMGREGRRRPECGCGCGLMLREGRGRGQ